MHAKVRCRAAEVLPPIIQLGGVVKRDRIAPIQYREAWPLARRILCVVKRDHPLIRGTYCRHVLPVPSTHRRSVKPEHLNRRLQDQVQQPI